MTLPTPIAPSYAAGATLDRLAAITGLSRDAVRDRLIAEVGRVEYERMAKANQSRGGTREVLRARAARADSS